MTAQLLDGKALADKEMVEVAEEVRAFQAENGFAPGLAVVLVGEDPASKVYVRRIAKSFTEAGMECNQMVLPGSISEAELKAKIRELNEDPKVSGIIVQLPLPKPLTQDMVTSVLSSAKDVDGITPTNAGLYYLGQGGFVPNTPAGGMEILKRHGIPLKGANAVVVGRSNIVGKPMAMLLLAEHATVTICHSRTRDLAAVIRQADIVAAAVGQAKMITGDMIKPGAAVVDFGINPAEKGIVGDVDFESAKEAAGWITPVPGGTGPMTNIMLLRNTLSAARRGLARAK
ncbi:MAG: bifunctional 5,10-methylenetetrahydrofolate dehydrogenase/5,10-methenyltetrahydrofolate cyclohydrolase [Chloroflexi bacterium]|nr:bifunctional 5,10-methylenetetrahydrofolate dehydrogenase/5,10-methenyltetrahydrofolate cyclohydrolase [Chloroflexota bacterium]